MSKNKRLLLIQEKKKIMTKIGLYYGSTTGNTERAADSIADVFGEDLRAESIDRVPPEVIESYDVLIFGISTWNVGQLEMTWDGYFPILDKINFKGKKVALFGMGDQSNYPDTYLDAMGMLYDKVVERGAEIICPWSTDGYTFTHSLGVRNGKFVGLALDEDNESYLTDDRVTQWGAELKETLGLKPLEVVA